MPRATNSTGRGGLGNQGAATRSEANAGATVGTGLGPGAVTIGVGAEPGASTG